MNRPLILLVEVERLIALDIAMQLRGLGCTAPDHATTTEQAIETPIVAPKPKHPPLLVPIQRHFPLPPTHRMQVEMPWLPPPRIARMMSGANRVIRSTSQTHSTSSLRLRASSPVPIIR